MSAPYVDGKLDYEQSAAKVMDDELRYERMKIYCKVTATHFVQNPFSFFINEIVTPKKRRGKIVFGFASCLAFSKH